MKFTPKHGIWLIGVAAIVGILVYQAMADPPGKRTQDGSVVTEIISTAKGDATGSFDITLKEGGDGLHEADHVFESIGSPAIEWASFDASTLKLAVRYDSSLIAEQDIRQMLSAQGYLGVSAADAVAATPSADGTTQELAVTPGDVLNPTVMSARAGIPLTIVFAAGEGHLASITIEPIGMTQSLLEGATIELPALQAGTYEFKCLEGYVDGTLIVE